MMRDATSFAVGLLTLIGAFIVLGASASAQSLLPPNVDAQPSSANVPATRSASVPVTWVLPNTNPDPILSINSSVGQLSFNGPNGSGSLNVPTPVIHGQVAPGQTARMRETIIIPQSFLTRALQAGTRTINMTRVFEVEVFPAQFVSLDGVMEINLTGSLGGEVQISRIDLRFQNEAVQIIVPQNHPPEVRADITYTGTGLFRAVWEIADPRSTAAGGNPIFRILRQERVRLGIGGFTRVKGPKLPADLTGLHIVRFRPLDGPLAGQGTVVRYFVKSATPDGEDWWKRYIRPHREGEGLVRMPEEPTEDELIIEEVAEPPEGEAPSGGGEPGDAGEEPGAPEETEDQAGSTEEPAAEPGL